MTSQLNEYCLHTIFGFLTPLDWVHVSEVCHLWKTAVSRMWTKTGNMTFTQKRDFTKKYACITGKEAQKVVLRAAPFISILSTDFNKEEVTFYRVLSNNVFRDVNGYFIRIGRFDYQVTMISGVDHRKHLFELLAKYSTKLTQIQFNNCYIPLEAETLEDMFKRNNITKLCVEDTGLSMICRNKFTDKIEELKCCSCDCNVSVRKLSQEHFPNLQKLEIQISKKIGKLFALNVQLQTLVKITSYTSGLKSLTIRINSSMKSLRLEKYKEIYKLSKLEELKLEFADYRNVYLDSFLSQLKTFLPQLRVIEIRGIKMSPSAISTLLSFPNLEILCVTPNMDFIPIVPFDKLLSGIQEMNHLTNFYCFMDCYRDCFKVLPYTFSDAVMDMLKKMPKLELFGIEKTLHRSDCQIFELVRRVIVDVMSQDRRVLIVTTDFATTTEELRVEKKEDPNRFLKRETFEIRLTESKFHNCNPYLLIDCLQNYLEKNMGEDVVFLRGVEDSSSTL